MILYLGRVIISCQAWVTICTEGLVTFILYYFIKDYIFKMTTEFREFVILIIVPFLACIPFYFFHLHLHSATSNMWAFTGMSLAAQSVIWSLIIGIFYRNYLSIREFRVVRNEINAAIRER